MEEDNKNLNKLAAIVYAVCAISLAVIMFAVGQLINVIA